MIAYRDKKLSDVSLLLLQFGLLWNGRFFGYEEHYDQCKWVKTLFPKIRATDPTAIAAAGTSCRHQILEPIERHYIQFLY
jgi:hypothetical protein